MAGHAIHSKPRPIKRLDLRRVAEQRAGRLARARVEAGEYRHFNYVVVNADLDRAVEEVASIVRAERRRTERCAEAGRAGQDAAIALCAATMYLSSSRLASAPDR